MNDPIAPLTKTNYRRDYICSSCGSTDVKLWRDYNTCASAVELKCAECATPTQVAYEAKNPDLYKGHGSGMSGLDADGVFAFREGDQLGGLVPAVPTLEGETFWGYTSVPASEVEWWHALPTYRDDARERRCLITLTERAFRRAASSREMLQDTLDEAATLRRRLALPEIHQPVPRSPTRTHCWPERDIEPGASVSELRSVLYLVLKFEHSIGAERLRARGVVADLRWKLSRFLYMFTAPFKLIVWGTATKNLGNGMMIRYGEEQSRGVEAGDRIAFCNGRALLLDRDEDSVDRAWSVMDHEQDGEALLNDLKARGLVQMVRTNVEAREDGRAS